jgi:hypothetical protein
LSSFGDQGLELLFPGHLARLKAKQEEAVAKELERERTRDARRKQALEQDPGAAALARKEDDLREAVLREMIAGASDSWEVSVIYLTIDMDTPSAEFLKRFATHAPPVRRIPFVSRWSPPLERGQTELEYSLDNVKWLSDTEAEISVSRLIGIDGIAYHCVVRLTDKGWKVVKARITAIT